MKHETNNVFDILPLKVSLFSWQDQDGDQAFCQSNSLLICISYILLSCSDMDGLFCLMPKMGSVYDNVTSEYSNILLLCNKHKWRLSSIPDCFCSCHVSPPWQECHEQLCPLSCYHPSDIKAIRSCFLWIGQEYAYLTDSNLCFLVKSFKDALKVLIESPFSLCEFCIKVRTFNIWPNGSNLQALFVTKSSYNT